ncbi:protein-disulfide reductase DsbD family protein [Varunaivibrio sulfuroxidans]|uniref:Suppressor for copper-sensitivity B n=1 Tax=Varunaivibrio sulfuroxidans TaxID=1773489 RepID=A0A4R3JC10_9PROT|nr:protein-disulfide reductase DsbD domain-containing protein [Varunaivibrio sulfuroxidans]TCS62656.1 suppressor for copper-sensitivity B [Varunaivibrio sulfuroxidans]WES30678.1 protein-disulfide reductase DsbD family protein [Varunaivibrio sulfuroxidans]
MATFVFNLFPRTLRRFSLIVAAALAVVTTIGVPVNDADAQGAPSLASPWSSEQYATVRLESERIATGDKSAITLGLHFKLKEGWKIYWRAPGDAGYPPRIDWSGSQNLDGAHFIWPHPKRFSVLGFETMGYKNEVVLPIRARITDPTKPLVLHAKVDYLACAELCVPYTANITLNVPSGPGAPSAEAHLIQQYVSQVPLTGAAAPIAVKSAIFRPDPNDPDKGILRITATARTPFVSPDVFIEGASELVFSAPKTTLNGVDAILDVPVEGVKYLSAPFTGRKITLTVVDPPLSAQSDATVKAGAPLATGPAHTGGVSLLAILGLALLGGLILNLMPCVLPVLSIKLLGVVRHGGGDVRDVRLSFIATSAGIVASFLVLAGALAGLKAAGTVIGWGIQFQQPWFLIAMTVIITLFAGNLWGFFEFRLPYAFSAIGTGGRDHQGLAGHFFSGAFATLLATPCSAPFLGTAVGFALARGTTEIFAIFAVLGIGLALPYLLVAAFPRLATRLPKPGRWMEVLRRILGFVLAATAIWLLSVLKAQVGDTAAILIGALMATSIGVLWLHKRLPERFAPAGWAALLSLFIVAFLVPTMAFLRPATPQSQSTPALNALWKPFDEAAISRLVAQGKTVFVDVTADWCITCQANKALVLSKDDIMKRLEAADVIAMEADWTQPNDAIARFLSRYDRYGIPFNIVYGPGAPKGVVLPELLTTDAVLNALNAAALHKR